MAGCSRNHTGCRWYRPDCHLAAGVGVGIVRAAAGTALVAAALVAAAVPFIVVIIALVAAALVAVPFIVVIIALVAATLIAVPFIVVIIALVAATLVAAAGVGVVVVAATLVATLEPPPALWRGRRCSPPCGLPLEPPPALGWSSLPPPWLPPCGWLPLGTMPPALGLVLS